MSAGEIARRLGAWFDRRARELPWRKTRDPYKVWVSEIMLQQTRVDTVVPYYERFLGDYPTLEALDAAPLDDVLASWSGLGYYRRARQLKLAVSEVRTRYGGQVPRAAPRLRELPGIGAYTAGAIASIAFDEPVPLVDGNVARVLARLFAIDDDMASARGMGKAWRLAGELVPKKRAGRHNQALMELGALVCTPRAPRCEDCPLSASCVARREGREGELPRALPKRAPRTVACVAAVVGHRDRVLLGQRREEGLYAGMWEPPLVEAKTPEAARETLASYGVPRGLALREAGSLRHVLSHRRLEVAVLEGTVRRAAPLPAEPPAPYRALAFKRPEEVALSTLAKKVLRAGNFGVNVVSFALLLLAAALTSSPARAAEAESPPAELGAPAAAVDGAPVSEDDELRALSPTRTRFVHAAVQALGGRGLRFNTPFRLATQLGAEGESLSLTAPYVDLGLMAAFGEPFGWQHGPNLHLSAALEGVPQQALSVTYMLRRPAGPYLAGHARAGVCLLAAPDGNVGGELALGGTVYATGALGVTGEVVGDLFYGAATYEHERTTIPVLSFQLGLSVDLEVLP